MKIFSENWRSPEVIRGLAMNKQIYIQVPLVQSAIKSITLQAYKLIR